MMTLSDGRNELFQWDTGRKLTVDAECSQVHFSNKVFGRSIDMPVIDGVVEVPDFLLQTDKDLNAWAFVGTAENGYTKISKVFKVNKRNKPADYVFTPHDQTTLGEIVQRLEQLEAMQDPDAIRDAVDEYLANNPIEVEETDPTVPDWAKQPEPPKVEIPEVNIPTTLPNPHALTFTGAVDVIYDGSKAVSVEIPQGGGGSGSESRRTVLIEDTLAESVKTYNRTLTTAERELLTKAKQIFLYMNTKSSGYQLAGVNAGLYCNYTWPVRACNNVTLNTGSNTYQYAFAIYENAFDVFKVHRGYGVNGVSQKTEVDTHMGDLGILLKQSAELRATTTTEAGFPVGTVFKLEVIL